MNQLPVENRSSKKNALRKLPTHELSHEISSFESDTADVLRATTSTNSSSIIYVIAALFLSGLVFSAVAKIDRVVTGEGQLVSVGGQLFVSPLTPGIVKDIKVKPGDIVTKGQVLAVLDPTFSKADLVQIEERLRADTAKFQRLQAEQQGVPMRCDSGDSSLALECSLWRQRQAEFQSTLNSYKAQIGVASANIDQGVGDIKQFGRRVKIASDVQNIYGPLVSEGYVSKLQVAGSDDSREELQRQLDGKRNEVESLRKTLTNADAQLKKYVDGWHSEIANNLVLVGNDIASGQQALEKARKQLALTELTAPEDGVVLRVGKISTGSVADGSRSVPGDESLITLAPLNKALEAEVAIDSKDIGFIKIDDTVTLRLGAYSFIRFGTLEGRVRTISEGTFTYTEDSRQVAPYFKARIVLGDKKLRNVPADFRLIPGLTLDADIKVGRRTLLSYVLDGVVKTGSMALREPE